MITVFKMTSRSPNFGGKHFSTKSVSKNNFKPKNQFQQANPTGGPKSDTVVPTNKLSTTASSDQRNFGLEIIYPMKAKVTFFSIIS